VAVRTLKVGIGGLRERYANSLSLWSVLVIIIPLAPLLMVYALARSAWFLRKARQHAAIAPGGA
jgi:hypothetical protein